MKIGLHIYPLSIIICASALGSSAATAQPLGAMSADNAPAGEPVCNKGKWAQSTDPTVEGALIDGLFNAVKKRACYGHLATDKEMQQILAHPIFNPGDPEFLPSLSKSQKAVAAVRSKKAKEEVSRAYAPLLSNSDKRVMDLLLSMQRGAVNDAGKDFRIKYPDLSTFVEAQPKFRADNGLLPDHTLRPDVLRYAEPAFTKAYRDRVASLAADRRALLQFLIGTTATLGSKLPDCVSKKERVSTSSVDATGNLQTIVSERDATLPSCSAALDDQQFARLISVREWHPYLWKKLSDTYASWLAGTPVAQRSRYLPVPGPIAVRQ